MCADPEDPEYVRQLRRPAEVKEDVRLMEDRKRVSLIMKTKAFRDELEQIVTETLRSGSHPTSLFALQQISELILPSSNLSQTSVLSRGESNGRRVTFTNNNNNIYFFYHLNLPLPFHRLMTSSDCDCDYLHNVSKSVSFCLLLSLSLKVSHCIFLWPTHVI